MKILTVIAAVTCIFVSVQSLSISYLVWHLFLTPEKNTSLVSASLQRVEIDWPHSKIQSGEDLSSLVYDIYNTDENSELLIEDPKRTYSTGDTIVSRQMVTGPSETFSEEKGKWVVFELSLLYSKLSGSPDNRQIGEFYLSISDYREARRASFFDDEPSFDKDFRPISLPAQRSREQDIANSAALRVRSLFAHQTNVFIDK